MAEVKIEKATIENLRDIQNLSYELCKKEEKEFDPTINVNKPFSKEGEEYFRKKIEGKDECALIAIADGKIVGYLVGGLAEVESYRKISQIIELGNMFVLENYRNLGIGTKLIKEFFNWCKTKGINRMKVVVSAGNVRGINFYKKNGFFDYDVVLERGKK